MQQSKNIKKHRNDIFRLTELLVPEQRIPTPETVFKDMAVFFPQVEEEQTGVLGRQQKDIIEELKQIYVLKQS